METEGFLLTIGLAHCRKASSEARMTAHSPLFSPLLRLRFLSALFLLSVLFPPGGHAQTQPSISLSCSPTLIVAGQDVTITATISPSTATPDSDLTVSVTDIGYGITHTDPVIPAGEYQGTGTVTDTDGARGQHISVPFHAPAGYSHGGSCSFTVAGGGTPPPPPPPYRHSLAQPDELRRERFGDGRHRHGDLEPCHQHANDSCA